VYPDARTPLIEDGKIPTVAYADAGHFSVARVPRFRFA